MRITCNQEDLSQALSTVNRAVGSRPTMPVLANVLLATDGGRLKLSATNLDLGITTWAAASVEEEGTVTVPANLLTNLVSKMPLGKDVELREDSKTRTLTVKCQQSRAQVRGIDPEEFPPMPMAEDQPTVSINQALCKELINQVAFGAARDDTRPVLAGVSLELDEKRITLAASDGFRLVMRDADELEQDVAEPVKVIVPARALQELERVLGDDKGEVEMTVTPNRSQVLFRAGDVHLVSRLIEGQFPNVRNFIPKSWATKVVVPREDFAAAMGRVTLFAAESANVVRLEVTAGENGEGLAPGRLMVEAQAQDLGESHDELDASIEGESTHLAFNAAYLNEFASALEKGTIDPDTDEQKTIDEVVIEITGPLSPGVVRGGGLPDYLHVIMPMHTVR
ncbi:MAG: DNA polymerase III subunit beta [Chloroflexota bacterium]|nr:DNA polymerase III subunit beta [Chloroflexota bacterium]